MDSRDEYLNFLANKRPGHVAKESALLAIKSAKGGRT